MKLEPAEAKNVRGGGVVNPSGGSGGGGVVDPAGGGGGGGGLHVLPGLSRGGGRGGGGGLVVFPGDLSGGSGGHKGDEGGGDEGLHFDYCRGVLLLVERVTRVGLFDAVL
jgi:hypothetical protein